MCRLLWLLLELKSVCMDVVSNSGCGDLVLEWRYPFLVSINNIFCVLGCNFYPSHMVSDQG